MDMETETEVVDNAPEEQFAYAASDVFSIVSPYVFHTHAPRVFSEISNALRRAQEASADVLVRLEASQLAQEQERNLRACEARQYVARLRELQALMTTRVEREIAGAKARKSLKRKLREEVSRSAELEKRLADTQEELRLLRKEFDTEKCASDERWRCELQQAVGAAREAERAKASGKVEALTVKRMRSLSSEVTKLKGKLKSSQMENADLLETLRSRIPPRSDSPSLFQRRAEKELRRLSMSAAAATATAEETETQRSDSVSRGSSLDSAGGSSLDSAGSCSGHNSLGLTDVVSGRTDRIKRSISEHAPEFGFAPQISRRRFCSDGEDDGSYVNGTDGASAGFSPSLPPPEPTRQRRGRRQQQPLEAHRTEGDRETLTKGGINHDAPRIGAAAAVAAAAAAGSGSPSISREVPRRSSSSSSTSSGRRRGVGSIRRFTFDAADARASRGHPGDDPARAWTAAQGGGDPRAAETLKSSSRWQHQRPLGGSGGTGTGSNAPSLHALLASGEFYPAGEDIANGTTQMSPGRLRPAVSFFRWGGCRRTVGLRDHNNNLSRFDESGEGWVAEDSSKVWKNGDEQEGEGGEGEGRAGVEMSAQDDGSDGGATAAAGMTSARAGGDAYAGVPAADIAGVEEAHLAQDDDANDGGLNTSKDHAARYGDTTDVFSLGAGQKSSGSRSRSAGTADTCGGGAHGTVGESGPRNGMPFESAAASARSGGSLLCSTFSVAGVHGGASYPGKGGRDGERGKCLDDLFPPIEAASAEDVGAATEVAVTGEFGGGGKQRPALDDLLRDMAVVVPVEGPGEGDNAGGSVVAKALHRRPEFIDVVLA